MRPGDSPSPAAAGFGPGGRESRLLETAERLVRTSPADETEVLLAEGRAMLTRFSANRIHQNVGAEEAWAVVRVVAGKRIGVATASSLRAEALDAAREAALGIARALEPSADWPGLPEPQPAKAVDAWDEATAEATADRRADLAGAIIASARAKRCEAAGAVRTDDGSLVVANSRGVAAAGSQTQATVHAVATRKDGAGYAEGVSTRIGEVDAGEIGRRAALKAVRSRRPRAVEPGRYDVVLEPAAVAEWLEYLAWMAFSGKALEEGRSPLAGRMGEKVTGEAVTIWDNALDRRTIPQAFDYEGMPKRRIALIEDGMAKAVATNYAVARRLGKWRSTGHALPATSAGECLPMHLFMKGGRSSARRLVAEMKRGLVVTRFHYTNILDPMKTVLTGMTRDGTFLVEDGEIVAPVRNLRYTQNVLEALGRMDGASRRLVLVRGPYVVPTVRIRGVQFTGATEF
jgi:predicted Zn-dependent protease